MAFNIALKENKITRICCSLSTFVKIICTVFLVIYFGIGISGVFWYLAEKFGFLNFNIDDSSSIVNVAEKEDGEINGFEEFEIDNNRNENNTVDESFKKIVIFSIVLVFALTGVMVNLLVLLSMRSNKRSLILPWLVYHTGVIIGCFAGGVYLVIYFAILKPQDSLDPTQDSSNKKYAVLGLLPIVGGIFFIFLWILIDQVFIQMGKLKNSGDNQKTIVIHSAPSIASIDLKLRNSSSVISQNKLPLLERQLYYSESINSSSTGKKIPVQRRAMTPNLAGEKEAMRRKALKNGTQSLPRSALRNNNANRQKTLFKTLMHQKNLGSKRSLNNSGCSNNKSDRLLTHNRRKNVPRSKSLEQILDSNSNSSRSSAGFQYKNNKNKKSVIRHDSNIDRTPNYWVAENTGLRRHINAKAMTSKDSENGKGRLSNSPIYSTPMKKSISMHNIIDGEPLSNMSRTVTSSQDNIQHRNKRDQIVGNETHYYQTRNDFDEYVNTPDYAPRLIDNNFVSNYCTVDNRRLPKHRGGLAERHRQREWLQRSAMHPAEGSPVVSSGLNQKHHHRQQSNQESGFISTPIIDAVRTIMSPPKPPRKSLLNSSSSNNLYASKPLTSPIKPPQQFYNAYEPSNNIYGDIILQNDNSGNEKAKNEEYINEVNKEIEDDLRFIKEIVSKNTASEPNKVATNTNSTMKTFGAMPKPSAIDTENLPPPPPSYLFNGEAMIDNLESNNRLQSPPTPPPPPPPPPQSLLPPKVPLRSIDVIDLGVNTNQVNDNNRSSYTETPSERSEVSDLDLSMLPLDAKSWSQRLERNNAINSNIISNGRQQINNGKRHNYENHDIKTVRIAPQVTQINYPGNNGEIEMENKNNFNQSEQFNRVQPSYAEVITRVDDLENLPSDPILHEMMNRNTTSQFNVKKDGNSNFPSSDDIWLPQPIYPSTELTQKPNQHQPSPTIKLDNSTKKKNVQSWLQKITAGKSTNATKEVDSNRQTKSHIKPQLSADYYGGEFGGDVPL